MLCLTLFCYQSRLVVADCSSNHVGVLEIKSGKLNESRTRGPALVLLTLSTGIPVMNRD